MRASRGRRPMGDVTFHEEMHLSRHPWFKDALRMRDRRAAKLGTQSMRAAMAFSAMSMTQKMAALAAGNAGTTEWFRAAVGLVSREETRPTRAEEVIGTSGADSDPSARVIVPLSTL